MKLNLDTVKCIVKTYIVQMYDNNKALEPDRDCTITLIVSDSIEFGEDMDEYSITIGKANTYIHELTYVFGANILEEYPNVSINIFRNSAIDTDKICTFHTYKDRWSHIRSLAY